MGVLFITAGCAKCRGMLKPHALVGVTLLGEVEIACRTCGTTKKVTPEGGHR